MDEDARGSHSPANNDSMETIEGNGMLTTVRSGPILSPAELFAARTRDHKLPMRAHGQKDFFPDSSEEQAEKLRLCREEQWQLLGEERVQRLGSLIKAKWKPKAKIVKLKSPAGKFWHTMGHTEHGKQLLYPEEALYLLECSYISLLYHGLPLSIQEAYETLLSPQTISLQQYQVYSHLKRIGYIVIRFDASMVATTYEKRLNLNPRDKDSGKRHRKRKRKLSTRSQEEQQMEGMSDDAVKEGSHSELMQVDPASEQSYTDQLIAQKSNHVSADKCLGWMEVKAESQSDDRMESKGVESSVSESDEQKNSRALDLLYGTPEHAGASTSVSLKQSFKPALQLKWDFTQIIFPNMASDNTVMILKQPASVLLPDNVIGRNCDISKWCRKINQKRAKLSRRERKQLERETRYKRDINADEKVRQCSSWKEYKELLQRRRRRRMKEKLPDHLWMDSVTPLIKPGQTTSVENLLGKIGILQSSHILDGAERLQDDLGSWKIDFDVYQADSVGQFRKSNPGKPYSRVCICSIDGPIPDLLTLKKLSYQSGDVPVLFALVDNGEISFYTFKEFKLPTDVYH